MFYADIAKAMLKPVAIFIIFIKTHGIESQGQEEALCMHVFWFTWPLQWMAALKTL